MVRKILPLALGATLLLGACARAEVTPASTPAATTAPGSVPTSSVLNAAPTSGALDLSNPQPTSVPQPARQTYTVQRGEVVSQLVLRGLSVPVQQELSFLETGIVRRVMVQRGDQVVPGQLLAELEFGDLEAQMRQARTNYEQDNLALKQAIEAGNITVRQATLDLEQAQAALAEARQPAKADDLARSRAWVEQAKADLATTRNNSSAVKNENLRQMNLAVQNLEVARARLQEAQTRYQREQTDQRRAELQSAEDAARQAESEVSRAQIAYDTARGNEVAAVQRGEAEVAAAEANLAALVRLPDPFRVAEAERNVARAETNLAAVRQRASSDPNLTKIVAASLSELQRIEQLIEARRLYAPFAGEVGYVEVRSGMAVRSGMPVINLVDPSKSEIIVNLDQAGAVSRNINDMLPGQRVSISFPRYPGESFSGEIVRLPGQWVDDNPNAGTTYSVNFDPRGMELGVGEPANLTVVLGRSEDTLWLPPAAVRYNRDRPFVIVKVGDEERRVDVSLGLTSDERFEIIAGVRENDIVLGEATR